MPSEKELLLISSARLCSLGEEVERAREKLRGLVDAGVPHESGEMLKALANFTALDAQWKVLEARYLALRDKMRKTRA